MMEEVLEKKLSIGDGTLWAIANLPEVAVLDDGTENIQMAFNKLARATFLTEPGLRLTAAMSGAYDKMRYILLSIKKLMSNFGVHKDAQILIDLMLKSPRCDTDAERFSTFTGGEKGVAAKKFLAAAAQIFQKEFDKGTGFSIPEKTPLRQLEKLRIALGFQTWANFTEAIKEEFDGMVLGTITEAERGQGIDEFIEKLNVLSQLQEFLHDLLDPQGGGNVASWYNRAHVISVKSLLGAVTAPSWFGNVTIDDYKGDIGERAESFDAFGQWLQKNLNLVNTQLTKQRKEQRKGQGLGNAAGAEHQTLAIRAGQLHARHASNEKLCAAAVKQASHHRGGGHGYSYQTNRPITQGKGGAWCYGNTKFGTRAMQENFCMTKKGPILATGLDGGDPDPMYCKVKHASSEHVCGAPHPKYLCPTEAANRAYRGQKFAKEHTLKKGGKRGGGAASPGKPKKAKKANICKFHTSANGCSKGNLCTWKHEGASGAGSGKGAASVNHVGNPPQGPRELPPGMDDQTFKEFQKFQQFLIFNQGEGKI